MEDDPLQPTQSLTQAQALASMTRALTAAGAVVSAADDDAAHLRNVLGHAPRGWWLVVARDTHEKPAVVATYPLWCERNKERVNVRPFPNLFWLTDAHLIATISELERTGSIASMEKELADDEVFRAKIDADHARYAQLRWAMLDEPSRAIAAAHGFDDALKHRGVGGLSPGSLKIKCLHAHVAHHLAMGDSAVGQRVMAMVK